MEPGSEHRWLRRLIGEWTYQHGAAAGHEQPECQFTGTESVRTVGGLWVVCEGRGSSPGGGLATTMMTLGYDPTIPGFVGAYIGSMMPNLWIYRGALDAGGNMLILDTEGPSFITEGKTAKYRDMIEFINDDHRTLSSQYQGDDGQWHKFMTARYHRVR
jgi:hypothetical protein